MAAKKRKKTGLTPMLQRSTPAAVPSKTLPKRTRPFFTPGSRWDRAARCLAYVLIGLAVLSGFAYVHCYSVNLYWEDAWGTLPPLFERYEAGDLPVVQMWNFHNEHRHLFPKLTMFVLGVLTKGNDLVNMYLTEIILLTIFAMYAVGYRKHAASRLAIWLMVPIAFLVFSLRQSQVMIWGFALCSSMTAAAMLAVFFSLSFLKESCFARIFSCAIATATIASFSEIQGLLTWPVGLCQIFVAPLDKRRKAIACTLWIGIGVIEWTVYFIGYARPSLHPPIQFSLSCFLAAIGGALFGTLPAAVPAGAVILILTGVAVLLVLVMRRWTDYSFYLATIIAMLATLGAITLGRAGFGDGMALSSRYALFSIPIVISTLCIFASFIKTRLRFLGVFATGLIISLVVIGVINSDCDGLEIGRGEKLRRMYMQAAMCTIDSQPDAVVHQIHNFFDSSGKSTVSDNMAAMRKLKYNVFANDEFFARNQLPLPSLPTATAKTQYNINGIGLFTPGLICITGWAVDWPDGDSSGNMAGGVTVVLDGVPRPACYGLPSNEVAKKLRNDKFSNVGFGCLVANADLKPGKHKIWMKIQNANRTMVYSTPVATFQVN